MRATEAAQIGQPEGAAVGEAQAGIASMYGHKAGALGVVAGQQTTAVGKHEQERATVAGALERIYERAKTEVTKILDGLSSNVDGQWEREKKARARFEADVERRMKAYKDKCCGGVMGKGRWLKDKVMGMPSEVNAFYAEARAGYLADLVGAVGRIADNTVGTELERAKARAAAGRRETQDYVSQLAPAVRKLGAEEL